MMENAQDSKDQDKERTPSRSPSTPTSDGAQTDIDSRNKSSDSDTSDGFPYIINHQKASPLESEPTESPGQNQILGQSDDLSPIKNPFTNNSAFNDSSSNSDHEHTDTETRNKSSDSEKSNGSHPFGGSFRNASLFNSYYSSTRREQAKVDPRKDSVPGKTDELPSSHQTNIDLEAQTFNPLTSGESLDNHPAPVISFANHLRLGYEIHISASSDIPWTILNDQNWSYITPDGLYQFIPGNPTFERVLTVEELQKMGLERLVALANEAKRHTFNLANGNKENTVNDINVRHLAHPDNNKTAVLTFEEWQKLENHLSLNRNAHTVCGYSMNEEQYLKFFQLIHNQLLARSAKPFGYNLENHQYPPQSNDWEKRLLNFVQQQIVLDASLAAKTAGLLFFLLNCVVIIYFKTTNQSPVFAQNAFVKNTPWLFAGTTGIAILGLILLRRPGLEQHIPHSLSESILQRVYLVTQSVISNVQNWFFWEPLLLHFSVSPENVEKTAIIGAPFILFYALALGYANKNIFYKAHLIHLNPNPYWTVPELALSYATDNSALLAFGTQAITNIGFYFDDSDQENELLAIQELIQSSAFALIFMAHLLRYLSIYLPSIHTPMRYTVNLLNGVSLAFLDSYAVFSGIFTMGIIAISGTNDPKNNLQPKNLAYNSSYFISFAIIYLGAMLISFPNARNLPELSTAPRPHKKNGVIKASQAFCSWVNQNNPCQMKHIKDLNASQPQTESVMHSSVELT